MKLPDFREFEPFNRLKDRMRIPRDYFPEFEPPTLFFGLTRDEAKRLKSEEGLEVEALARIGVLVDGTLAFKESTRVLLYIRDVARWEPRFHVADCETLREMRQEGRFYRYVISTRTDETFALNERDGATSRRVLKGLKVCQNCLARLSYNGFSTELPTREKREKVSRFSIDEFFRKYPMSLHTKLPEHDSESAPVDYYSDDWPEVSKKARQVAGWKCGKCGLDLSRDRKFLDVHHKNGRKSDNSPANLEVLCVGCHAKQRGHSHMKREYRYLKFQETHRS